MVDTTGPRGRGRLLTAPRRGVALAAVLVVASAVVGVTLWQQRENGPTSVAESRSPNRPGAAVQPEAGLRLLVADTPAPFVLDVNEGTVARVSGLPTGGDRSVGVAAAGPDALLLAYRFCPGCRDIGVYLLRHGTTSATLLARALQAVPSQDGRGAWLLQRRRGGPDRCLLAEIDLAGRARSAPILVGCRLGLVADLPAGLFVSSTGALGRNAHSAVIERDGDVRPYDDPYARPAVGDLVLSGSEPGTPLVLRDMRTGANRRLDWPSRRGFELGDVSGSPDGRHAIVSFTRYSPRHRLDLWLLDTRTGRWQHLPGMPAPLVPKDTDVEWTRDGRVVVLSDGTARVWRPGETTMETKSVPGGSQPGSQFVVW
jgi:hypothetical protein